MGGEGGYFLGSVQLGFSLGINFCDLTEARSWLISFTRVKRQAGEYPKIKYRCRFKYVKSVLSCYYEPA